MLRIIWSHQKKEKLISENPDIDFVSEIEGVRLTLIDKNFPLYYNRNEDAVEILSFWDNRRNTENLDL